MSLILPDIVLNEHVANIIDRGVQSITYIHAVKIRTIFTLYLIKVPTRLNPVSF